MSLRFAALLAAAMPVTAFAQSYGQPEIVRGLCQKDGCDEFRILNVERVRSEPVGTLWKTRIKTFHASGQGRIEREEENGFVFCSLNKPTLMSMQDGKVLAFQIAPFPTEEARETTRLQANFYAMYFAICHGNEAGRSAVRDLQGTAERLGYRSNLPKSTFATLTGPEAVFGGSSGEAPPVSSGQAVNAAGPSPQLPPVTPRQLRTSEQREARQFEPRYRDRYDDGERRYVERRNERGYVEPNENFDGGSFRDSYARSRRDWMSRGRSGEWHRTPTRCFGLE